MTRKKQYKKVVEWEDDGLNWTFILTVLGFLIFMAIVGAFVMVNNPEINNSPFTFWKCLIALQTVVPIAFGGLLFLWVLANIPERNVYWEEVK